MYMYIHTFASIVLFLNLLMLNMGESKDKLCVCGGSYVSKGLSLSLNMLCASSIGSSSIHVHVATSNPQ